MNLQKFAGETCIRLFAVWTLDLLIHWPFSSAIWDYHPWRVFHGLGLTASPAWGWALFLCLAERRACAVLFDAFSLALSWLAPAWLWTRLTLLTWAGNGRTRFGFGYWIPPAAFGPFWLKLCLFAAWKLNFLSLDLLSFCASAQRIACGSGKAENTSCGGLCAGLGLGSELTFRSWSSL